MDELKKQTRSIFSKFAEALANIDTKQAVCVIAAAGMMVSIGGIAQEVQGQSELLVSGGARALEAYKAAMQTNPLELKELVVGALKGNLESFGGANQIRGLVGAVAGASVVALTSMLGKQFSNVTAAAKNMMGGDDTAVRAAANNEQRYSQVNDDDKMAFSAPR